MHERGVVVSFNSDSDELGRRMQLEAAKAVRYGGVDRAEALDFVTLNPAKQLGVEDRVGSLESGKDADFVIWSGDPLSTASRCEQTWIDGRKYFDRDEHLAAWEGLTAEREALLAKVRASTPPKKPPEDAEEGNAGGESEALQQSSEETPEEERLVDPPAGMPVPENLPLPEDLEGPAGAEPAQPPPPPAKDPEDEGGAFEHGEVR
jgi:hypothetical protein